MLLELAMQSQFGPLSGKSAEEFEKEKQQAIAKYQRKLDAARFLFEEGDLTREEYVRRKDANQQEIAHWEARTSEVEKAAIELRMCMEVVRHIQEVWASDRDEDRQQVARMLFEEIVYDLNSRQILAFTLKSWASRFLILRAALYETEQDENREENENAHLALNQMSDFCPIGAATTYHFPTTYPVRLIA